MQGVLLENSNKDPEPIRALSLHQPWASLIAVGAKKLETRSRGHSYRGPLLIHAAKQYDKDFLHAPRTQRLLNLEKDRANATGLRFYAEIPLGAFVAVAKLVATIPTESVTQSTGREFWQSDECYCGDFSPGRFAWVLEDIRPLPEPVPARGFQVLWRPKPEELTAIPAELLKYE